MIVPGRVSVVMPYWERPNALMDGLFSLSQHYRDARDPRPDLEVVVVDDGSSLCPAEPVVRKSMLGIEVKVVSLPKKTEALNPCVPINAGVAASTGEYICLTNPETSHRGPIMWEMRDALQRLGRSAYVHAAVWCPQSESWHTNFAADISAGYHFLSMMHRDLWDRAGGFDEDYRAGYCFDDADFVQRMLVAGAEFHWMDHLVADHSQGGDAKHWRPREDWQKNFDMFHKKWPNPRAIGGGVLTYERLQNWPSR